MLTITRSSAAEKACSPSINPYVAGDDSVENLARQNSPNLPIRLYFIVVFNIKALDLAADTAVSMTWTISGENPSSHRVVSRHWAFAANCR